MAASERSEGSLSLNSAIKKVKAHVVGGDTIEHRYSTFAVYGAAVRGRSRRFVNPAAHGLGGTRGHGNLKDFFFILSL